MYLPSYLNARVPKNRTYLRDCKLPDQSPVFPLSSETKPQFLAEDTAAWSKHYMFWSFLSRV